MSKKAELLRTLKDAPADRTALDNLVAFFTQRGDFQALYEGLQEVVEEIGDRELLTQFQTRLVDIVRNHLDHADDPVMAANLKLRLAGLLFDRGEDPKAALILVTEAFEKLPSEEVAQRALHMLKEMKLSAFVVQLLKRKAATDKGTDREADTLFQLGHAALAAGNVHEAEGAFATLETDFPDWQQKAADGNKQAASARRDMTQAVAELEEQAGQATDVEKPVLQTRLGRRYLDLGEQDKGIELLEQVMDATPSDEVCMELVSAYKELEQWQKLIALVEQWAEQVAGDDARRELFKERVRVYALKLGDRKAGYQALDELYKRYAGLPDVVEFCVQIYSECEDYDSLAELLGRARQDTKDRSQERRYLEWEAALKWRKLGDLEAAERLYRRIKSIDPRNEAALLFYEEYSREKGDFRKLYSILSNRQSLAPDSQKVKLLKAMAEVAQEQLNSPDRAIDAMKKVLVLAPDDDEAFARLAELLEETRRWHAVIELYSSKVDRLPDEGTERKLELLSRMREIYSAKDKLPVPEMVVTIYRRILQIDPQHGEAIEALGEYYRKNNRWGELTEVLERRVALTEDPVECTELHKEIAQILVEYQHQEGAAVPHLEKVVELNPDDDEALGLLARAYRSRGEYEKFFALGQRQLDMVTGTDRKELLEELATIALERLQVDEEACELLEQLFAADPKHPWALRRLRQLYDKLGRYEELAVALERGIAEAPATKKRSLKEKLGVVLSDKLARYDEAKAIFHELLEENPGNRQAKQYLQRILAQAGDFAALLEVYQGQKNLPGLLRFLDEFRQKEEDPERARAAGLEVVRLAAEVLDDANRATRTLEGLLEQFPTDCEIARRLLASYPDKKADLAVSRALAVLADNGEGEEAATAARRLGDVLEKNGEHEAAFTRTLGLFLEAVRDGDLSLLALLTDRAERAESLESLAGMLQDLLDEELPEERRCELVSSLAGLLTNRLKDKERARQVLEAELKRTPDSLAVLQELERLHMVSGDWAALETVVRAKAEAMLDLADRKEELFKLARLYEEIVGEPEKAGAVYRELRELDPDDGEAYAGLKRVLDELEDWAELAAVLEDERHVVAPDQVRDVLMQLAALRAEKMADKERAAEAWTEVVTLDGEDEEAWQSLLQLFAEDEALDIVMPVLEARHEEREEWESLVAIYAKQGQLAEEEAERLAAFDKCAALLADRLGRHDEAFSYLTVMAGIDPAGEGLLGRLEEQGRAAGKEDELYAIYKGLLGIGESDFASAGSVTEEQERQVGLGLADLAEARDDLATAIAAVQKARESAPAELVLFNRLEELLEAESRYEDLLHLLEEKQEVVWDEQEKVGLVARLADVLATHLGREEESIPYVEELHGLTGESEQVAERLEDLYLQFERWAELAGLLKSKMARLEGEERQAVAYQLAIIQRDHLGDLDGAYQILSELVTQDSGNEAAVEGLCHLLRMNESDGFAGVVLRIVATLEPLAREQEDWLRLTDVLEVKAQQTLSPPDAALAWLDLGRVCNVHLDDPAKALEAFSRAVQSHPGNRDAVAELVTMSELEAHRPQVIEALAQGVGELSEAEEVAPLAALASLLREEGESTRAAAAFERLLEMDPEELANYRALDDLYLQAGDSAGRMRVLGEMVERLEGREQADALVTLAELRSGAGEQAGAVEALDRALLNPELLTEERRALAFHLQEEAFEAEERWFDLSQSLQRRLQFVSDGDEKRALLYRIAQLEEEHLDNADQAITNYFAIIDLDPLDALASESLVRLLESAGRFSELEELLATQAELTDEIQDKQRLLFKVAQVRLIELAKPDVGVDALAALIEQEIFSDEVVALLETVAEEFPDVGFRASQLLETAYRSTGQYRKLAETYKTQIDRYSDEVDKVERYRELAALSEGQFNDLDGAFHYISQAFKLEPTSSSIHDQLVSYARERASFDELFDIYLDVLVQLDEAEGRNNLRRKMVTIYHIELQDLEHAELIYRDMLDDEPGNEFALEQLQALYQAQENWDRLVEVLRLKTESARFDKARITTFYEIANIYRQYTGDITEALDTYEQILALDPRQWDAYRGLESLNFERGDGQSVAAVLRRELEQREDAEERKETRLRLAAILVGEQEEYENAVIELKRVLEEFPGDDQALVQLADLIDGWDYPSAEAIDLLVTARTEQEAWDDLIVLYTKLAARVEAIEDKKGWFERIYQVRTDRQGDERGAYAICKIMLTFEPADEARRSLLVEHAISIGEGEDLVDFLEDLLENEQVADTELAVEYQYLLATVLTDHADRGEDAIPFFELVADSTHPDHSPAARDALRALYQEVEEWPKYTDLLERMAAETADMAKRRAYMLEASQVARLTLEDHERAYDILGQLAQELPDDDVITERYEQLLVELEKVDDLETLLRGRIERTADQGERGEIRLRLGNLILNQDVRVSEGVEELIIALDETVENEVLWNILSALAASEETPEEDRLRICRELGDRLPEESEWERLEALLDVQLNLTEDEDESNRIHLRMAALLEGHDETDRAFFHYAQSLRLFPGVTAVEEKLADLADAGELYGDHVDLLLGIAPALDDDLLKVRYLLQAAELKLLLDDAAAAAAIYQEVLETDEYNSTALEALRQHFAVQEAHVELAAILERLIAQEEDAEKRLADSAELARIYGEHLEDIDKARQWWEELLHETSARAEACAALEEIYQEQEEWELLCDLLLEEREEAPDDEARTTVFLKLAGLYEQYLERHEEALHWYKELLLLDPAHPAGLHGARRCATELEDWENVAESDAGLLAQATGDEAVALRHELAELLLVRLGRKSDGLVQLQELLVAEEVTEQARSLALAQVDDAEIGLSVAVLLEPVLEAAEEWEELVRLYRTQLEALDDLSQKAGVAARAIDVLVDRLDDTEQPFELLGSLLAEAPSDETLLGTLADLAERTEQWARYGTALEEAHGYAVSTEDMVRLALDIAALHLERLDDRDGALRWYNQVLEDAPGNETAMARVEELLKELERYEELARFYEESIFDLGEAERIPFLLKVGFLKEERLDDAPGAVQSYKEVLTIDAENVPARERLEGLLESPTLGLAAVEILEPIYRQQEDHEKLSRLLTVKAGEVEGSFDRAQLLAESAQLLAQVPGREAEAFATYLKAIKEKRFDTASVLEPAEALAGQLGRWQDLANGLEHVIGDELAGDARQELLRRLALIYLEKLTNAGLAGLKLRELLQLDPDNEFALQLLSRVLEEQGEPEEQIAVLDQLGELSVDGDQKQEHFQKAAELSIELEQFERAGHYLHRALKVAPEDADLMEQLASIYRMTENWHELVAILETRSNLLDEEGAVEALLEAAHIAATSMEAPARGLALCRLVVDREPDNKDALLIMTDILREQGKQQEQLAVLERLARLVEGDELVGVLWQLKELSEALGDPEGALASVQRILEVAPDDANAMQAKIELLRGSENLYSLVTTYEERAGKTEDPEERAELLYEAAITLADEIGDQAGALEKLQEILAARPEHLQAMQKSAQIHTNQQEYELAIEAYEKLAQLQTDEGRRIDALKAAARLALQELDDAEVALPFVNKLREALPDDPDVFAMLLDTLEKMSQWEELAKLLLERVKQTEEPEPRAALCKRLARVYRDGLKREELFLNWTEEAHKAVEDAELVDELITHYRGKDNLARVAPLLEWKTGYLMRRKQTRDVPELLHELGTIQAGLNRPDRALVALRQCVETDGAYLPGIYALARLLFEQDQKDEALSYFQTLLLRINELESKDQKVDVFLKLAGIYREKEDQKKARTYLKRLLSIDKNHAEARKLLDDL